MHACTHTQSTYGFVHAFHTIDIFARFLGCDVSVQASKAVSMGAATLSANAGHADLCGAAGMEGPRKLSGSLHRSLKGMPASVQQSLVLSVTAMRPEDGTLPLTALPLAAAPDSSPAMAGTLQEGKPADLISAQSAFNASLELPGSYRSSASISWRPGGMAAGQVRRMQPKWTPPQDVRPWLAAGLVSAR